MRHCGCVGGRILHSCVCVEVRSKLLNDFLYANGSCLLPEFTLHGSAMPRAVFVYAQDLTYFFECGTTTLPFFGYAFIAEENTLN